MANDSIDSVLDWMSSELGESRERLPELLETMAKACEFDSCIGLPIKHLESQVALCAAAQMMYQLATRARER